MKKHDTGDKSKGCLGCLAVLGIIVLILTSYVGINYAIDKNQERRLYQQGFRLLEEQLGTYIKENYIGIKKVEFTDIRSYPDSFTFVEIIVTDERGNRCNLSESINGRFGTLDNFYGLEYDGLGKPIIELKDIDRQVVIDVSNYKTLPDKAKLETSTKIDRRMAKLIKNHKLIGVKKNKKGSPKMIINYNLTYRGDVDYGND